MNSDDIDKTKTCEVNEFRRYVDKLLKSTHTLEVQNTVQGKIV